MAPEDKTKFRQRQISAQYEKTYETNLEQVISLDGKFYSYRNFKGANHYFSEKEKPLKLGRIKKKRLMQARSILCNYLAKIKRNTGE